MDGGAKQSSGATELGKNREAFLKKYEGKSIDYLNSLKGNIRRHDGPNAPAIGWCDELIEEMRSGAGRKDLEKLYKAGGMAVTS